MLGGILTGQEMFGQVSKIDRRTDRPFEGRPVLFPGIMK